jgi:DNA-binding SARP family transcriptional activator
MTAELQLSLLGKLQISRDGAPVTGFVSAKAQALLVYLAVTARPHDRQALAALLWGDMPQTEARANLRSALSNLRKLLEPYLLISRDEAAFNQASSYWLDVAAFEAALVQPTSPVQGEPVPLSWEVHSQALRQAIELYQGDFLEGFAVREALAFEEWLLSRRERLRQLAVQALHTLALEHTARGEYAAGIDYTTRLLALEPWREEAHRQLMILLARSDQRSAALAQYELCCRILAAELGVEPLPETTTLYERLKAAGAARPHNLPPQATPFVGRQAERAHIDGQLEQPTCRLLTLVGSGGIGKTRLALQTAAGKLTAFQDGVFFIPLAGVNAAELLVSSIAEALQLPIYGAEDPKAQLLNYLRPKEMLLVLDNFEH